MPQSTRELVYGVPAAPASFTNPLVVRGLAKVHITDLAITTSLPADKEKPLVWGGVYVYDATNLQQPLAFTYTGATWSDERKLPAPLPNKPCIFLSRPVP